MVRYAVSSERTGMRKETGLLQLPVELAEARAVVTATEIRTQSHLHSERDVTTAFPAVTDPAQQFAKVPSTRTVADIS
jgi:hypothetical protein